jgi:DNA-binding CsgD family transcriptional regulator
VEQVVWLSQLGNTGHAVFAVDDCQRILTWNTGAEALLGHAAEAVVGQPCYKIIQGRVSSGKAFCRAGCGIQRRAMNGVVPRDLDLLACTGSQRIVPVTVATVALSGPGCGPITLHWLRPTENGDRNAAALRRLLLTLRTALGAFPHANGRPDARETAARTPDSAVPPLSRRETDVLRGLATGRSARDIATTLGISSLTVRTHVRNLLRKTNLHTQTQLALFAVRNGLD